MTANNIRLPEDFISACGKRTVLAGFSGGMDSTALLLLLQKAGINTVAIHFEHGLRGMESIEDAEWAEGFARSRNIPFLRINLTLARTGSVENSAREARLQQWQQLTSPQGRFPDSPVILAHHNDDAVETMLERLARGGNVSSLTAMRPRRIVRNVEFLRPLLSFTKAELEEYLRTEGVTDYRFDSSNSSADYFRNHIRNNVIPLWTKGYSFTPGGLSAALQVLSADGDYLEKAAEENWLNRPGRKEGGNKLSVVWFRQLHPSVKFRILGLFLRNCKVPENNIAAIIMRMDSKEKLIPVNGKWFAEEIRGFWKIRRSTKERIFWHWRQEAEVIFDGDRYRVRTAPAPDFTAPDSIPDGDRPSADRVWFPLSILPEILELRTDRSGIFIQRTADSQPEPLKKFKKADSIMLVPDSSNALWLAGVRRTGCFPLTAGEPAAVFERVPPR